MGLTGKQKGIWIWADSGTQTIKQFLNEIFTSQSRLPDGQKWQKLLFGDVKNESPRANCTAAWLPSLVLRVATLDLILVGWNGKCGKWITQKFHHRGYALITNARFMVGCDVLSSSFFFILLSCLKNYVSEEGGQESMKDFNNKRTLFFLSLSAHSRLLIQQEHFVLKEAPAWQP